MQSNTGGRQSSAHTGAPPSISRTHGSTIIWLRQHSACTQRIGSATSVVSTLSPRKTCPHSACTWQTTGIFTRRRHGAGRDGRHPRQPHGRGSWYGAISQSASPHAVTPTSCSRPFASSGKRRRTAPHTRGAATPARWRGFAAIKRPSASADKTGKRGSAGKAVWTGKALAAAWDGSNSDADSWRFLPSCELFTPSICAAENRAQKTRHEAGNFAISSRIRSRSRWSHLPPSESPSAQQPSSGRPCRRSG